MQNSRLAILCRELRRAFRIRGPKADGKNIVFQLEDPFQRHALEGAGGIGRVNRHRRLRSLQLVRAVQDRIADGDSVPIAHNFQC